MKRIMMALVLLSLLSPLSPSEASATKTALSATPDISVTQSQVMKCVQTKITKTTKCQEFIAQLNAWSPVSSTSELTKAETIILKCMLTGGHSKICIDAALVVSNSSKLQASYVQARNDVVAVSMALRAAVNVNSITINKTLYRQIGKAPLPSGSTLQTPSGNITLPSGIIVYLTLTSSQGNFCVSKTSPDKSVTWVSTYKNLTPIKSKPCVKP